MSSFSNRQTGVGGISFVNKNPNGNPAANNEPRCIIYDNGFVEGYMTDVSLKRLFKDTAHDYFKLDLYVARNILPSAQNKKFAEGTKKDKNGIYLEGQQRAFQNCIDIRWNGFTGIDGKEAEVETEEESAKDKKPNENINLGTQTGPVQISNALSLNSIEIIDDQIGKVCHSTKLGVGTFGTHKYVRYGLYHYLFACNPFRAKITGCSQEDLETLFKCNVLWPRVLESRAKAGEVAFCYVFDHGSELGLCSDQRLQRIVLAGIKQLKADPHSLSDFKLASLDFIKWALKKCGLEKIKVRDIVAENKETKNAVADVPSYEEYVKEMGEEPVAAR